MPEEIIQNQKYQDSFHQRYEVLKTLGQSNFATTYLVRERKSNTKYVAKALPLREIDTFRVKELFEREAKILSNLDHPNIPKFLESFLDESEEGASLYLVQEYVEGENLSRIWEASTGKPLLRLQGPFRTLQWSPYRYPLSYSGDGKILATTGLEGSIQLWHGVSGEPLSVIPAAKGKIEFIGFTTNGNFISANRDGAVSLWGLSASKEIASHTIRSNYLSIAASPDGKFVAAGYYSYAGAGSGD